jgi:uncharacterized protein (UPF0276 family)
MIMRRHGTSIAAAIGIGLRAPHVAEVIATRPAIGWFEIHAENYMGGGPALVRLDAIRRDYPLSLHGVGLSLGTAEGLDADHRRRLVALVRRCEPILVSEHLSWSVSGGTYLADLLPLPLTEESLAIVVRNVTMAQEALGRPLLVENPSAYLRFRHSTMTEPEFLGELVRRSGCGLLCDVNNIHVTCANLGGAATAYLDALPADAVGEIHLAGHSIVPRGGTTLLIDDHAAAVASEVWQLYRRALARFGLVPSLVEWDKALPALPVLLEEAEVAARIAHAAVDGDASAA